MSGFGAAAYYIRKLYKNCIQAKVLIPSKEHSDILKKIGSFVYFSLRPIFALGFSLLVIVGLNAGKITIVGKAVPLNNGFIFISMFLSFFVGFSSGKLIKALEKKGGKWISSFFGVNIEDDYDK